ncbi:MAG: hypothetical protein ABJA60_06470 [Nitrosospira sp.]
MFWMSVADGLGVFAHWQIWASALMLAVVSFLLELLVGLSIVANKWWLTTLGMLAMLVFQTFAIFAVVAALAPILFHLANWTQWQWVWDVFSAQPWQTAKFVGGATFLAFVFAMFGAGNIPGALPSIIGFFSAARVAVLYASSGQKEITLYPGFFPMLGYLLLGVVCIFATIILINLLVMTVRRTTETDEVGPLPTLMASSAAGILPFISIAMYCAWLGFQLRA